MKKITILKYTTVFIFLCFCWCCNDIKNGSDNTKPYFEGEISLSESRGLYGSLFKVNTTYFISENHIKREQKLGGINSVFNSYAGIFIDLKKDSVVLYYSDMLSGKKNKHSTSIKEYTSNKKYKNLPNSLPSPVDNTFKLLPNYKRSNQVKDSIKIKEYTSDYTLYQEDSGILKQEVFDTKEIKVKRELLEMVFMNIPKEINFLLKSDLKTTISDISNDSIVNGKQSKAIDLFLRDVFQKKDSIKSDKKTDLEKLSKNKWINLGLKILKKGVDLNIHIATDISELTSRKLLSNEISFTSLDFIEILDIDDFSNSLPHEGGGDFDD
ncbi:hypothetical protein [Aquimarina muelleri]|uniref:Uncharacterized protein n=1 Tax=Aquimarina muelleri TaxID=279356 RepID=A0A918JYZ6_9FLAO|nr:hypothetical protein [Aquimarina muelleri]MCX2764772.1 hypothetical protein [Aquimarina muelleri]GGX33660.1 hypothetical protein GCM10007384_37900 [Aquimarina muelleri]